jgi:PAS domain S-box-containing protein
VLITAAGAALIGWFIGSPALSGIHEDYIPMAPNTALTFLLLGSSLVALARRSKSATLLARCAGLLTVLLACARLVEYAAAADLSVDQWVFNFPGGRLGLAPVGKTAFFTAATFLLSGVALLLLTSSGQPWWANNIARGLSVIVGFIGLAFLLGYLYGAPLMYGGQSIPMALNTAAAFFVFGSGLLVKVWARDITERREAQERLREAHAELEARVEERTAELSKAVAALEEEVAERRRVEGQLHEGQELFKAFMDNSPAVAFMKDEDGGYVYANATFERRFNLTAGDWFGKTDFDLWPAEVARRLRENDAAVLSSDTAAEILERAPSPGGIDRDWLSFKFPLAGAGGRRFLAGMAIDITERRQAEEALRESEEQLRQAQKLEAVGRLAGGVAHDFNNLLTVIGGQADILLRRGAAEGDEGHRLVEIKRAAERAASLTRQLLAFSRKQVLQPKVLELNRLVTETGRMLSRLVGDDVELVTVLRPEAGRVNADPGQVEQVLMNLIVNARDAMPRGGKIVIETAKVDLDGRYVGMHFAVRPGPYVMLAVSDTGTGMDAGTLERAFEPFFTTKEVGKGTGLGLSTVYGIVKQSGGNIWVYSEAGRGTTFKIYLPRVEEEEIPAGTDDGAEPARGSETLLLVEDEAAVRGLAREVLLESGYTVIEAADGAEALLKVGEHGGPIHLLVTDIVMPGMSGKDLAQRLSEIDQQCRVLYMSGYTDDAIVRHGVLEPGTDFLEKPFSPDVLTRKVRAVLDAPRAGE